jgi:hypothetical protein
VAAHAHGTQGIAQAVAALDKVIMGLYSGGAQIMAGTDAGVDDCPHGAYVSGLEALAMVGLPDLPVLRHIELVAAGGTEHRPAAPRVRAAELAGPAGPGPR